MDSPTRSVIVADDDADIRTLVAMAVARSGLELIDELGDGDSAWDAIQTFVPDIVLLDVAMPGKTGLEISRLIRADTRLSGIRVIVISAAVEEAARQAGLDAGVDEYLFKPFSPRKLADRLGAVAVEIDARGMQRAL
jgi:DNA-binding response OmpR family regulator